MEAVLVDPYFDVFRQLDREETPPTVGELFGSSRIAFILPDNTRSIGSVSLRSLVVALTSK